jgi:hypothetical protein
VKTRLKRLVSVGAAVRGSLQQRDYRHGREYTPRLWSVFISVPVALATAAAIAWLIYHALFGSSLVRGAAAIEVTKTALTIMAGIGAVLAGVYAYRKQRLEEGASHRTDADQFTSRYNSAANQLGSTQAAIRLAGVYALARLADDWKDQRQVCVDVLCAYLRMSQLDPDTGEDQVHQTITRVIIVHLQPDARVSWSSLNFDLTGVVFKDPVSFTNATFSGESTSFDRAIFSGDFTTFDKAKFSGASTSFAETTFSSKWTTFKGATFSGKWTNFDRAMFSGKFIFDMATFSAESTRFFGATFSGKWISFFGTTFCSDRTSFAGASFSGRYSSFAGTTFSGKSTSFSDATFSANETSFFGATFSGEETHFDGAKFFKLTKFVGATFSGTSTSYDRATFSKGSSVQMDGIRLINGASVTKDDQEFLGWPPQKASPRDPGWWRHYQSKLAGPGRRRPAWPGSGGGSGGRWRGRWPRAGERR